MKSTHKQFNNQNGSITLLMTLMSFSLRVFIIVILVYYSDARKLKHVFTIVFFACLTVEVPFDPLLFFADIIAEGLNRI